MTAVIETKHLTKTFGGLTAVNNVSFEIHSGVKTALIGPNGAGKSTLLNMLSGLTSPSSGEIKISGKSMNGIRAYEAANLGIGRTFQNVQIFENMSVIENVMAGCHRWTKSGIISGALRLRSHQKEEKLIFSESMEKLAIVGLENEADLPASNLPFGKQRLLEIARALASHPQILLLDEPASGLSARETLYLANLLEKIVEEKNITLLLVDHDLQFVMEISERIIVLDQGVKIAEGTPEEIQSDKCVIAAYLGEDASPKC